MLVHSCTPKIKHRRILPSLTGGGRSQEKNRKLWDFSDYSIIIGGVKTCARAERTRGAVGVPATKTLSHEEDGSYCYSANSAISAVQICVNLRKSAKSVDKIHFTSNL